jgi:hypothetical protein
MAGGTRFTPASASAVKLTPACWLAAPSHAKPPAITPLASRTPSRWRVSAPVRDGHRFASPATKARWRWVSTGRRWQSRPKISPRPSVGRMSPSSSRIVVVLPTPLRVIRGLTRGTGNRATR